MLVTQKVGAAPQQGATAGRLTIALLLPMCTAALLCGFALGHWHGYSYEFGGARETAGLPGKSREGRRGLGHDVTRVVEMTSRRKSFPAKHN